MKSFKHHFVPHEETGEKALAIRHEALLLYAIFLFLMQFGLHLVARNFPGVLGFASNISVEEIVLLTNQQRKAQGLTELKRNDRLSQAAVEKASYMLAKNYWSHNAPDGTTPWYFVQKYNYHYLYAGENLAKDFQNSADVVDAWMASRAGHRENILNGKYQDIGVAVVNGVLDGFETTLVVQMFGSSTAVIPEARAERPPAVAPAPTGFALESPTLVSKAEIPALPPRTVSKAKAASTSPLVPVVDVVALGKSISYTFGFFLLGLFVLDSVIVVRKNLVRLSGHSLAHIMIVLLFLVSTWLLSPGTIR